MKGNPKVAVNHFISAVKSQTLHDRLISDLSFSHQDLRKYFHGFSKPAIKLAVAFQIAYLGASNRSGNPNWVSINPNGSSGKSDGHGEHHGGCRNHRGNANLGSEPTGTDASNNSPQKRLWEPHRRKMMRHLLKDCT